MNILLYVYYINTIMIFTLQYYIQCIILMENGENLITSAMKCNALNNNTFDPYIHSRINGKNCLLK